MDDLLMQYSPLVYSIAKKFYGTDKNDLVQAGFLGLIKAYKNYNEDLGCKFSTYAYQYIYGEMYEMANGEKQLHVRKDAMRLYKSVIKYKELLTQKEGREVSYEEVCTALNIDYLKFVDILNSLSASISIDNTELNLTKKENIDDLILLRDSLKHLSDIERKVIETRYLGDLNQSETAEILGLSQVSVSRIEKKSREKIKKYIAS